MSATDNCPKSQPPCDFPGTLNVFLHGLIGVLNRGKGIELLIPDVGPDHVYRFGEFLGEVTLPPSPAPYHITGITGKDDTLFPLDTHVCTDNLKFVCAEAALYARIKLPNPLCVHSYLTVNLTGVVEDPKSHLHRENGKIFGTMTPVLEYSFCDPRDVLFGGDPLNVAPIRSHRDHRDQDRWFMNLHIFAEEDLERAEHHTVAGFDAIAGLFDFEAAPRLISVSNIPPAEKGQLPPGTTTLEFLSLALRTRELGYLGRRVRRQLLNNQDPAIVQVSSVGADPITCLPLVSQQSIKGATSHA